MFQNEFLNRLAQNAPVTVTAKAMLENILNPAKLDDIFQRHFRFQRERKILFSFVVELMLLVTCKIRPKIHSAYKAWPEELPFTVGALYDKIACNCLFSFFPQKGVSTLLLLGHSEKSLSVYKTSAKRIYLDFCQN